MESGSEQTRITKRVRPQAAGGRVQASTPRKTVVRVEIEGDETMQREARSRRIEAVQAHPVAELLECPPAVGLLLNQAAQCLSLDAGQIVFRQAGICRGLYLVISGQFLRRAERMQTPLTLGPARAGELVELAAALGDGRHTYTLVAQAPGSVLMLPTEALNQAFQSYPPLRMKLLEELAREVSRAYNTCCFSRAGKQRCVSPAA
jgi:hypothetical protein